MADETLHIIGVEATQAVQYFDSSQFLSNPADYGPNNSIELVNGKPLVFRVYPTVLTTGAIDNVSVDVRLRRRDLTGAWRTVTGELIPLSPGTMKVQRGMDMLAFRGGSYSFDFLLPASGAFGMLRFAATISAPGAAPASIDLTFSIKLRQTLSAYCVLVNYRGPASRAAGAPMLDIPAPTIQDLQSSAAWAVNCFPVSSVPRLQVVGTLVYDKPLTDPPSGGIKAPWQELLTAVQLFVQANGNPGGVYYGLLPSGIPIGTVAGLGGGGTAASFAGNGLEFAHEYGHAVGLDHAPCPPDIEAPDPGYPEYAPLGGGSGYRSGKIGDFGFDCSALAAQDILFTYDIMSYCGPRWISPYNYRKLLRNPLLQPIDLPLQVRLPDRQPHLFKTPMKWLPDPPPPPVYRSGIAVIGVWRESGQIGIHHVVRTPVRPDRTAGEPSGLRVQLLGARNKVLAATELTRSRTRPAGRTADRKKAGAGSGESGILTGIMRAPARGLALRVVRGRRVLWSQEAPPRPIRVVTFEARVAGGRLVANWQADPARGEHVQFWLRWRSRGLKAWNILMTGIRATSAEVGLHVLPSGRIEVALVAHDGFDSVASPAVALTIPHRPAAPAILHPLPEARLVAGRLMRLWGSAARSNGYYARPGELAWKLDGRRVGKGNDIRVAAPAPGTHECVLSVRDGTRRVETSVRFTTVEPGAAMPMPK